MNNEDLKLHQDESVEKAIGQTPSRVFEDYAKRIGKTVADLTRSEKARAIAEARSKK